MRYRILKALSGCAPVVLPIIFLLGAVLWAALFVKAGPDLVSVVFTGEVTPATAARLDGATK